MSWRGGLGEVSAVHAQAAVIQQGCGTRFLIEDHMNNLVLGFEHGHGLHERHRMQAVGGLVCDLHAP